MMLLTSLRPSVKNVAGNEVGQRMGENSCGIGTPPIA